MSDFTIPPLSYPVVRDSAHPVKDSLAANFRSNFASGRNMAAAAEAARDLPAAAFGRPLLPSLVRESAGPNHEAGLARMIIDQFPGGEGSRIDPASAGLKKLANSDQNGLLHLVSHLMALKKLDANDPRVAQSFAKIVKAFERDDVFADGVATRKYDSSKQHVDTIAKCSALKSELNDLALKAYGSVEAFADAIKLNYVGPALSMVFRDHASNGGVIDQEAVDRLTYQAVSNGNSGDLGKMIEVLWKIPELDLGGGAVKGGNAADAQPPGANAAADRERFQCGFHHCCNRDNNERLAMMMEADKYRMYMDSVLHDREETARVRAMGAGETRSSSTSSATSGINDPAMSALQKAIRNASSLIDRNLGEMDGKGKQALADLALRLINVEAGIKKGESPEELKRQVAEVKADTQAEIKQNAFRAGAADASQQTGTRGQESLIRQFAEVQNLMEQAEPTLDDVGLSELEALTGLLASMQSALVGAGDIDHEQTGSTLRELSQRANQIILDSALRKAALDSAGKEAAGRELVETRCSAVLRKAEQAVEGLSGADRDAMKQEIDALKAQLAAVATTPVQDLPELLNEIDVGSDRVAAILQSAQAQHTLAQGRERLGLQLSEVQAQMEQATSTLDSEGLAALEPLADQLADIQTALQGPGDIDHDVVSADLRGMSQQVSQITLDCALRKASADSANQEAASRDLVGTRCATVLDKAEQAMDGLPDTSRDAMQQEIDALKAQLAAVATTPVQDLPRVLNEIDAGSGRVEAILQSAQAQHTLAQGRERLGLQLSEVQAQMEQATSTLDSEGLAALEPLADQLADIQTALQGPGDIDHDVVSADLRGMSQQVSQITLDCALRKASADSANQEAASRDLVGTRCATVLDKAEQAMDGLPDTSRDAMQQEIDALKAQLAAVATTPVQDLPRVLNEIDAGSGRVEAILQSAQAQQTSAQGREQLGLQLSEVQAQMEQATSTLDSEGLAALEPLADQLADIQTALQGPGDIDHDVVSADLRGMSQQVSQITLDCALRKASADSANQEAASRDLVGTRCATVLDKAEQAMDGLPDTSRDAMQQEIDALKAQLAAVATTPVQDLPLVLNEIDAGSGRVEAILQSAQAQQTSAQGREQLGLQLSEVQAQMEQATSTLDSEGLAALEPLADQLADIQTALQGPGDIDHDVVSADLRGISQQVSQITLDCALRKASADSANQEAASRDLVGTRCATVLDKAEQAMDGLTDTSRDAMQQEIDALKAQLAAVATTPVQDLPELLNEIDVGSDRVAAILQSAQAQHTLAQGRERLGLQLSEVQAQMEQATSTLDSEGLAALEPLADQLADIQTALQGPGDIDHDVVSADLRGMSQQVSQITLDCALRKASADSANQEAASRDLVGTRCATVLDKAEQAMDGLTDTSRDAMQQEIDTLKAQLAAVATTPVQDLPRVLNEIDAGSGRVEAILQSAQAQHTLAQGREQLIGQLEDVRELIDRAMPSLDAEGKDAVGPMMDELDTVAEALANSNDVDQAGIRRTLRTVSQQVHQIILDGALRKADLDAADNDATSRDLVASRCFTIISKAEQAAGGLSETLCDAVQGEIRSVKALLATVTSGEVRDLRQVLRDVEACDARLEQIIQTSQAQQASAHGREQLLAQLEHAIDLIENATPTLDSEGQAGMAPLLGQLNTLSAALGGIDKIDQGDVGNQLRSITHQANQIILDNALRGAGTEAAEAVHVARDQNLALLDSRRNDAIALIDANINDLGDVGRRQLDPLKAELEGIYIHQGLLQPDIDAIDTKLRAAETSISDAIRECRVNGVLDQIESMRSAARTTAASAAAMAQLSKEKSAFGAPRMADHVEARLKRDVDACVGNYMKQLDAVAATARNILDPMQTSFTIPQVKHNLNALYDQFAVELNSVVNNAEKPKFRFGVQGTETYVMTGALPVTPRYDNRLLRAAGETVDLDGTTRYF